MTSSFHNNGCSRTLHNNNNNNRMRTISHSSALKVPGGPAAEQPLYARYRFYCSFATLTPTLKQHHPVLALPCVSPARCGDGGDYDDGDDAAAAAWRTMGIKRDRGGSPPIYYNTYNTRLRVYVVHSKNEEQDWKKKKKINIIFPPVDYCRRRSRWSETPTGRQW